MLALSWMLQSDPESPEFSGEPQKCLTCQRRKLPECIQVVMDQLRLWEKEARRVAAMPATLYSDFESAELWAGTVAAARDLGGHLWDAPPRPTGGVEGFAPFLFSAL